MTEPRAEKRTTGGDLVIPAASITFALYYIWSILDSPWEAKVAAYFVGLILIGLSMIYIGRAALALARHAATLSFAELTAPRILIPRRLILLVLTLAYVILLPWGGFTLSTFAYLALAIGLLNDGRRKALVVTVAASLAIAGYFLFIVAFETRFPKGPFETLMAGLF